MKNKKLKYLVIMCAMAGSQIGNAQNEYKADLTTKSHSVKNIENRDVKPLKEGVEPTVLLNYKANQLRKNKIDSENAAKMEKYKKDLLQYELEKVAYDYAVTGEKQVLLPGDIYDIEFKKLKFDKGFTKGDLLLRKGKLPSYFAQHDQARELLLSYGMRHTAWGHLNLHNDVTLQAAIDEEAMFKIWELELNSQTTSPEMLAYLERTLSLSHMDLIKAWLVNHADTPVVESIQNIIGVQLAEDKISKIEYFNFHKAR